MFTAFLLALCAAIAQAADWNSLMAEAGKLQTQGAYTEAETKFQEALSEAESFGAADRRLGLTLNNLGALYRRRVSTHSRRSGIIERCRFGVKPAAPSPRP